MYKVVLVEDEELILKSIKACVKWANADCVLVGEASDGESALVLINERIPDIIITDIKMPFMDGLELCHMVKKSLPKTKIIILSGHDEFKFAQEAVLIGVAEYLLKPVTSEEMLLCLKRVCASITAERSQEENAQNLVSIINRNTQYKKTAFLNDLVSGAYIPAVAIQKAEELGINLISKHYIVNILTCKKMTTIDEEPTKSSEETMSSTYYCRAGLIAFERAFGEIVAISMSDVEKEIAAINEINLEFLKKELKTIYGLSANVHSGNICNRISGLIQSFESTNMLTFFDAALEIMPFINIDMQIINEFGNGAIHNIGTRIYQELMVANSKETVLNTISQDLFNVINPKAVPYIINYVFVSASSSILKYLEEIGEDKQKFISEISSTAGHITNLDSFYSCINLLLDRVFEYKHDNRASRYSLIIHKANNFIENNYNDSSLTLGKIAAYINLSPSYFSYLYSRETGITLSHFILNTRIERAIQLLAGTQQSVSEIADNVGFKDTSHFVTTFKKITGYNTKHFRTGMT